MGVVKGWLYCILWYCSILAGYAGLFCPLLPVLFISNKAYRFCTDVLFTFWQYYPTVLLEMLCGCDIQITGDVIRTNEMSILIMNHRTRTDWNFIWPTVYHCVVGSSRYWHSTKFILKDIIRHIPGPGWVMQLACFIYIKRSWITDKEIFTNACDYFAKLSYKCSLLVFPEGTDLTPATKKQSDHYAEKNNLKKYSYVLHPRTTGFVYLTQRFLENKSLDAIYDLTLVYPDLIPQNEHVLLKGNFPKQVKIHLARYPKEILPKTEEGLKEFLEKRWLEKEKILQEFHGTGHFLHGQEIKANRPIELKIALIFWTLLPIFVMYLFIFSYWFRHLVIAHTLFLVLLNFISDGFQQFEIVWFNFKTKILRHFAFSY